MGKKDPIPFQARKRQRTAKKNSSAKKSTTSARPNASGGELDDVRDYWQRFFRHPLSGPGRTLWTERMLWGNALITAVILMVGLSLEHGFQLLSLITTFIDAFFLFFLLYYLFPWLADWVFRQMKLPSANVDGLKLEMIVLSGWVVIASLFRLLPYYYPLPYWAALIGLGVLMLLAVHRRIRSSWSQAALATVTGAVAVAAIMMILATF